LPKNGTREPSGQTPITVFPDISPYWRRLRTAVRAVVAGLGTGETLESSPAGAIGAIGAGASAVHRHDGCLAELQLPEQRTRFADVVGRTDFLDRIGLGNSGSGGTGTWTYDPVIKRRARFVPAGAAAFLHFGPYIKLALGRYEVVFTYRAEATAGSWNEPAGEIDVLVNRNRIIAADKIMPSGNTLRVSRHIFEVKSAEQEYEFRVQSNGTADVYLYGLTLQGVTPRAPDRLDEIGLIMNGQRPEVGEWSMDPIFCRAA
jgi:hypothetical protein